MYIDSRLRSFYGRVQAVPPSPVVIPSNPADALAFASRIDREADACLAEGRCVQAERLAHLALEARCRATGVRA